MARIGGIAAPQIIMFRRFDPSLPSLIFGAFALAGGGIENKHPTDVESPPPPPRVCMRGVLRTSTRPTLNPPLLLRASL